MSLKVGDRVKVVDTGKLFSRCEGFLHTCNVGKDVINKWSNGHEAKVNEEYNIIAIKPHEDNRYGLIAVIENEKGVFVINVNGLEKVVVSDTKKIGNFKIKCIKDYDEKYIKDKIYNFVDGFTTWDDGKESYYYCDYSDFVDGNRMLSDYFEEYIDEVQPDSLTSQVTEIKEFDEDIVFEFSDCFTSYDYIRAKQKKPLTRVESATTKTVQEVKETKEVTKNSKIKERKEENIMKNNLVAIFGETVGKITDGMVAITFSGQVAIKRNEDEYVRFNAETNTIENQMDFVMKEAEDFLFLLPVAEVQNGDVIKKNNTYYQVVGTGKQNGLSVVNIKSGTKKTLIRETNIMGFNFYFKVVNLFGDMGSVATSGMNPMLLPMLLSDNEEDEGMLIPMLLCGGLSSFSGQQSQGAGIFGGMNPMMMALAMGDKKSGKGSGMNMKSIMMMSALGGQQTQGAGMNPMMMALAMGDGKMDAKTLMMMSLFGQQQAPVAVTKIAPVVNNVPVATTAVVTVPPVE